MSKRDDHYSSADSARLQARAALLPQPVEPDDGHWDGFVAIMRRSLPVVAVLVAILTMLWPLLTRKEVSFTLSRDDVSRTGDQVRMENLRYTGTDNHDRPFEVQARTGEQDNPSAPMIRLSDIVATMEVEPGTNAAIRADDGVYETATSELAVSGPVRLNSDSGYALTLNGARLNLKDRAASSTGGVKGSTPIGTLAAQSITIDINSATGVFEGQVRVHITPRRQAAKDTPG